jgi:hypothetical protein
MREGRPVTVAELLASGIRPSASEAAALALAVCDRLGTDHQSIGVPPPVSSATVQVERSGLVTLAGGAPGEDDQTVALLGRLLEEMLSGGDPAASPEETRRLHALARRACSGTLVGGVSRLKLELRPFLSSLPHRDAVAALVHRLEGRRNPFAAATVWVPPGKRQSWWRRRVAVVGTALLLLGGAGAAYFFNDAPPLAWPPSSSRAATATAPREAPAWDLAKEPR